MNSRFNKICTMCKTGQNLLELDPESPFCPYISLYKDNNCPMFKEISNEANTKKDEVVG